MASGSWEELYEGGGNVALPGAAYDVEIDDARPNASARQVWLDLKVLYGPQAGTIVSVSVYLPEPGAPKFRGQMYNFQKRLAGFNRSALAQMDPESPIETQLGILADALTGQRVQAEIELRSDGEYAGTNQLNSTKPSDAAPAAAPVATGPAAAQVNPVAAPSTSLTDPITAASAALDGEVPF